MRISDWSSDVCSSDLASRSAPVESLRLDSGDGKQFISCSSTYDKGRGGRIAIIRPAGSGAGAKGEQFELRSEEHTSELQSLMRISYAVFCLKKKKLTDYTHNSLM